ncbi:MAG: ABC transporter permease [Candidatus Woesearchaeota archaeon]
MKTIFKIIKKNIKLLVRSKGSALIVIFGPLLVIFLVGIAFDNSSAYSVKIGAFSEKYSQSSESILGHLGAKQFSVTRFDSEGDCVDAIKQGRVHTCMIFAPEFAFSDDAHNQIIFEIDYSKVNLVWMILDTLSGEIESKSSEISMDLTNVLLRKIDDTQKEIVADKALAVKLAEGTNKVKSDELQVKTELSRLDLDMNLASFPIRLVVNRTYLVGELAYYSSQHSMDLITSLRSDLTKLNTSSADKDRMIELLDQTKLKLENINKKITNQSADLKSMADDMDHNIRSLKQRIDAAGSVSKQTITKLEELQKTLASNIDNILALQSSFNKIINNLQSVQVSDAEGIVSPVKTTIRPVTSGGTHLNYIFPSLIILVVMFISLLLSSTLVVMEKSSRAYFRNFITPTRDIVFVLATYFTGMLLILLQLIVILVVALFFFKSQLLHAIPTAIPILLVVSTFFVLAGMAIGYLFNSEETSTLASISVGSVFLFLSNVILPIESMPRYVMDVAAFNPFVISENLLRKSVIFHYSISTMYRELLILLLYALAFFVLIMVVQKLMKRHFLRRYAKMLAPVRLKKSK